MKKFSLMLVTLLSLASAHNAFGCIGWADGLVAELQNKYGHCSDLPTKKEQKECYAFKREYAQFWAATTAALNEGEAVSGLISPTSNDGEVVLNSVSLIAPHFKNIKALKAALKLGNENACTAEQVLAKVVAYHAANSTYQSFGRIDICFIENTKTGIAAPKCR